MIGRRMVWFVCVQHAWMQLNVRETSLPYVRFCMYGKCVVRDVRLRKSLLLLLLIWRRCSAHPIVLVLVLLNGDTAQLRLLFDILLYVCRRTGDPYM
jgi:hypothetical protein